MRLLQQNGGADQLYVLCGPSVSLPSPNRSAQVQDLGAPNLCLLIKKHNPPFVLCEWGATDCLLRTIDDTSCFLWYRSDAGISSDDVCLRICQSIKSRDTQTSARDCSRVAHHSEMRFVFGKFAEMALSFKALDSERCKNLVLCFPELTSPLDSLPSCVYNIQHFLLFVNGICLFFIF